MAHEERMQELFTKDASKSTLEAGAPGNNNETFEMMATRQLSTDGDLNDRLKDYS